MFNIICELPETVARTLVPRMRVVKGTGKAINYLTPPRILLALVTAWLRRGRWFDEQVSSVPSWKLANTNTCSIQKSIENPDEQSWRVVLVIHSGCNILQGRALYAAEADRIRNWAENRTRFSFTDAMEMYTENTWVSVFSLSVVCAFIILSTTNSTLPGT